METQTHSAITTDDDVRIAYRFDGEPDRPTLLLSNSIGTDLHMWDGLVPALTEHFRLLRYDSRGHGESGVPNGPYALDRLGRDVVELLDALDLRRVHVLGLSLGGMVAQWLGIHAPERLDRLVLANTAAYLGPPRLWTQPIADLLAAPDMRAATETFLRNWFPADMRQGTDEVVAGFRRTLLATRREGVAGSLAAVRDADLRRTAALIRNPTLVIAGEHDTVTSARHGEELAAAVPDARFTVLPTVHLAHIERQAEFLDAVVPFLTAKSPDGARHPRVRHVNPDGLHRSPAFSQAVVVERPAKTIYIGGQNGVDSDGKVVGPTFGEQARQAFRNIATIVASEGVSLANVVHWRIAAVHGSPIDEGVAAFLEVWNLADPPPAISVSFVAGLAPGVLVEIDAVAVG